MIACRECMRFCEKEMDYMGFVCGILSLHLYLIYFMLLNLNLFFVIIVSIHGALVYNYNAMCNYLK